MSHKSRRIAQLIDSHRGRPLDAHYLAFFDCFNRQLFFEAHEVLEPLWLSQRGLPKAPFYKALIQLAGGFVHVQKQRSQPALALFRLAAHHLSNFPDTFESLDLSRVRDLISNWMALLSADAPHTRMPPGGAWPALCLEPLGTAG